MNGININRDSVTIDDAESERIDLTEQATKVAIIYDFDGTLSPGSMQEHSFIPELGYESTGEFWADVKAECRERDGDEILTYMQFMISRSNRPVTREALQKHGAENSSVRGS